MLLFLWLIDWLIDWLVDWLIDWLIDWTIERLNDWTIDRLIDCLLVGWLVVCCLLCVVGPCSLFDRLFVASCECVGCWLLVVLLIIFFSVVVGLAWRYSFNYACLLHGWCESIPNIRVYTGKPVRNYLKLSTQWFLQPPEAKTLLYRWIMDRFAGFQGGCLSRIYINTSDRSASWYGSYPSASAEVQISNSCY